jgi:hypothetical protein
MLRACSDDPDGMRPTPLGEEVNVNLMMVFMGIWEPYEIPMMLEEYEFISERSNRDLEAPGGRGPRSCAAAHCAARLLISRQMSRKLSIAQPVSQ